MATSDFLTFAAGGGANVITQAAYAALGAQATGFATGIAYSNQLNKVWRQSSFVAAGVANFMLQQLSINIVDDGNLTTFTANLTAAIQHLTRIKLTADTTFYVSAAGNDANSGLVVGSPWLTIQYAINVLQASYDMAGFTATIQCAAGAYNATVVVSTPFTGGGSVILQGDTVTPSNCTITVVGGGSEAISVSNGATLRVQGFQLAAGESALYASVLGIIYFQNINFGACLYHLHTNTGANITALGPYSIVAGATNHALAVNGEINLNNQTITLTGAPNFSGTNPAFLFASALGIVFAQSLTFSGGGTGPAYLATTNGFVATGGTGASLTGAGFSAGSTTTGGIFT